MSDEFLSVLSSFNPSYTGNPSTGTLTNSADPHKMQYLKDAAFHQGLHCLLIKTEIHNNLENSTCNPLKYTMGSYILYQYVWDNLLKYKGLNYIIYTIFYYILSVSKIRITSYKRVQFNNTDPGC